ncbi:oxidoreductase [Mycobacterium sp. E802]|uniref:glucose 1-dehydrogenase n=1 Tax=Mycobacterium sp. E802 TaxID=1834152 RepID=UPI0008003CDD|nr:glucose 1-dehydrogenase [Mycobacterium sp. E802]OBG86331.1 oxidoreductase [Mycobacterium sp. E802]
MALESFKLDGQVAIVTGAGRGVGAGIARVLAEAGATIVGTARTPDQVSETIKGIKASGGQGLAVTADATSREDGEQVVAAAMENFGRVDILVNNAGGAFPKPFLKISDNDLRRHFEWNTASAFIMSQLVVPHMLVQGAGSIINISSGAGRFGIRGFVSYCVAKGALENLTRALAQELAPKIRVNAIALGSFKTDALEWSMKEMPESAEQMKENTPLHRFGDVEDLGRLAVYLCSHGCFATNAIFHVDGGLNTTNWPLPIPDL